MKMHTQDEIIKELNAMKAVGMDVPAKAFKLAQTEDLDDYDDMKRGEVADLLCDLARI
jgi:hypothetical protein